ncbi:unnamed protein product [Allacma fusca]|uniref:C3H1-type domain-containing protein n=1 Tax=Allacma fusca TaxID=39272 RepID=A0A8J2KNH3_9HEXA|nr:unnamed protein product [Allacma fusca]
MLSLVAAYSDSNSSEEDNVTSDNNGGVRSAGDTSPTKRIANLAHGSNIRSSHGASHTKFDSVDKIEDDDDDFVNFSSNPYSQPLPCFEADDDDDEEDEDDDDELKDANTPAQLKLHLNNPFRQNYGSSESVKPIQSFSVFEIPFLDQETKKSAALERHVKMTQVAGTHEMINGKKICWNYRKGKCRFGHNCTFAHDSDIQQSVEKKSADIKSQSYFSATDQQTEQPGTEYVEEDVVISSPHLSTRNTTGTKVNSDDLSPPRKNDGIGKKGKKRHGLTQTLQPGKKIMKTYYQTQGQM